jgi:hypothetical protein
LVIGAINIKQFAIQPICLVEQVMIGSPRRQITALVGIVRVALGLSLMEFCSRCGGSGDNW